MIIGLVLFDNGYGGGDSFSRADDRKRRAGQEAAKESAGLISEGAAVKAFEDGIPMMIYVAAGRQSHLRSLNWFCGKMSATVERILVKKNNPWPLGSTLIYTLVGPTFGMKTRRRDVELAVYC